MHEKRTLSPKKKIFLLYFSFYVEEALSFHERKASLKEYKFSVLLPDVTNHTKLPALSGFVGEWYCMVSNMIDKSGRLKE